MANPRKFSEKIALQKQKQAEGTAEFEKIMNEVKATRVLENSVNSTDGSDCGPLPRNASIGGGSGGSGTSSGASGGGASPDANTGGGPLVTSGSPTTYRESRGRSVGVGPMRRPSERKQDRSPYGSTSGGLMLSGMAQNTPNTYLSPPMDTSWRRSNSDSALHQTLNMAEGNFGPSPQGSLLSDLNSLHANYHHHQHGQQQSQHTHQPPQLSSQRSHSPNICRSYSPQAQRRKNTLLQQQQQIHNQRLQMQQQQHQQQQLHQHLQSQQQHMQQQNQQQFNAKFNNSSIPANAMFKSIQEQQLNFANTGSLPDLTSVHFSSAGNAPQLMQQQQTLSPILSPHHNNGCHDRDQSPSPFSPPACSSHQQQNSPSSAANTPTASNQQTSPHLSFTNLSVQSPGNMVQQNSAQNPNVSFNTLPTLGASNSTSNLTDYRQPVNPPSPGSSPGLLTSGPTNDLQTSAPASPIRHCPSNLNNSSGGNDGAQNQQIQTHAMQQTTFGTMDASQGYSSLNPAFQNHFEQFHLGDSSQSPQNNYETLEFEDFVASSSSGGQQQHHNTYNNKMFDLGDLSSSSANTTRTHNTNTKTICNNNNNNLVGPGGGIGGGGGGGGGGGHLQQQRGNSQQFQQLNNNSSAITNGPSACRTGSMNNNDRHDILSTNSSPIPSPLSHCIPSPSSPLPIPMSAQSPAHHQQLSLSVQTSPHHSPLHSPHHTSSPLSVSSPGLTILGGSVSPAQSPSAHLLHQHQHQHNHINNQNPQQLQHNLTSHNNQQQNQTHTTTTTTNIPQIVFSDYSSRDIFDNLDLDLGQIDEPGLQMLSDQNPIMIADPSIEDSFRRDLN